MKLLPSRQFGYIVLTTSAGIMDHEEARRKHVSGNVLGLYVVRFLLAFILANLSSLGLQFLLDAKGNHKIKFPSSSYSLCCSSALAFSSSWGYRFLFRCFNNLDIDGFQYKVFVSSRPFRDWFHKKAGRGVNFSRDVYICRIAGYETYSTESFSKRIQYVALS